MKRLRIPFVIILTMVLVLSTAVVASAAKPEHAGGKGRVKTDVTLVTNTTQTETNSTEANEGTAEVSEQAGPYDLSQMLEQIEAVKANLPGNGNAWGRIAKELSLDKAPGSISALVEQLKQMSGYIETDVSLPEITEQVTVTVFDIEQDGEGNFTGRITIAWSTVEGEDEVETYIVETNLELLAQLEVGAQLDLSIADDGSLVVAIHQEPVTNDEDMAGVGTEGDGADTGADTGTHIDDATDTAAQVDGTADPTV